LCDPPEDQPEWLELLPQLPLPPVLEHEPTLDDSMITNSA